MCVMNEGNIWRDSQTRTLSKELQAKLSWFWWHMMTKDKNKSTKEKYNNDINVVAFLISHKTDYFRFIETMMTYSKLLLLLCNANMETLARSQTRSTFPSLLNAAFQRALFPQNTLFWLITPGPHWIWMTSKRVHQALVMWLPVRARISIKHHNEPY